MHIHRYSRLRCCDMVEMLTAYMTPLPCLSSITSAQSIPFRCKRMRLIVSKKGIIAAIASVVIVIAVVLSFELCIDAVVMQSCYLNNLSWKCKSCESRCLWSGWLCFCSATGPHSSTQLFRFIPISAYLQWYCCLINNFLIAAKDISMILFFLIVVHLMGITLRGVEATALLLVDLDFVMILIHFLSEIGRRLCFCALHSSVFPSWLSRWKFN